VARADLEGAVRKIVQGARRVRAETEKSNLVSFDAFLMRLDETVAELESRAASVDAAFERLAELVGDARRAPEDVFASIWTFARACDASRASRLHRENDT
jgi:hypothetical protein